jgi:hypothetical protein
MPSPEQSAVRKAIKEKQTIKVRCPYCDGTGRVIASLRYKKVTPEQDKEAFRLRKLGMTYRGICKKTGIRGPQSAKIAVEREGRRIIQEQL